MDRKDAELMTDAAERLGALFSRVERSLPAVPSAAASSTSMIAVCAATVSPSAGRDGRQPLRER